MLNKSVNNTFPSALYTNLTRITCKPISAINGTDIQTIAKSTLHLIDILDEQKIINVSASVK